jgi:hypothetical protein
MTFELAYRQHDGVAVRLTWDKVTNCVRVSYTDERSGDAFAATVPSSQALDAFNHPSLYRA